MRLFNSLSSWISRYYISIVRGVSYSCDSDLIVITRVYRCIIRTIVLSDPIIMIMI